MLSWVSRKKRPIEAEIEYLAAQERQALDFYTFFQAAMKRGYTSEIIVIVDGQAARSSLVTDRESSKKLFEFLANFAAGERLRIITDMAALLDIVKGQANKAL